MKDQIGNRLKDGHLVQITFPDGMRLNGHVVEIHEGGIVAVGGVRKHDKDLVTPGICKVRIEVDVEADPRSGRCASVVCLLDPAAENKTQ